MATSSPTRAEKQDVLPSPFRWTRERYERAVDAGVFQPSDKVELLDGEILTMPAHGTPHTVGMRLAINALTVAFGGSYDVRCQNPIALEDSSEPEPDVAVVEGSPRDYLDAHPSHAVLVVEVSDSSLDHDRARKLRAYARSGVPDYWILNLIDRQLEVFREPDAGAADYGVRLVLRPGETLAPLGAPGQVITVDDLLP